MYRTCSAGDGITWSYDGAMRMRMRVRTPRVSRMALLTPPACDSRPHADMQASTPYVLRGTAEGYMPRAGGWRPCRLRTRSGLYM